MNGSSNRLIFQRVQKIVVYKSNPSDPDFCCEFQAKPTALSLEQCLIKDKVQRL